jgi:hypothetical protein
MLKKSTLFAALIGTLFFAQVSRAEDECKADADCAEGKVCVLAVSPHVCKDPQPAGAPCKRDAVCASKKCDIPEGQEAGKCT